MQFKDDQWSGKNLGHVFVEIRLILESIPHLFDSQISCVRTRIISHPNIQFAPQDQQ